MLIRPHLTCVPECRELAAENKRLVKENERLQAEVERLQTHNGEIAALHQTATSDTKEPRL